MEPNTAIPVNQNEVLFDSTDFKPNGSLGIRPGLPTFLVFGVTPCLIAGGLFIYTQTSSGSLDFLKDVLPFMEYVLLPFIILGVILFRIFFYKKPWKRFMVNSEGIRTEKKFIPWKLIKNFHMLGDAQSEKIGAVSVSPIQLDPTNIYSGGGIYVLVLQTAFFATIRVQVSPESAANFEKILNEHGITRRSRFKLWLFGNL